MNLRGQKHFKLTDLVQQNDEYMPNLYINHSQTFVNQSNKLPYYLCILEEYAHYAFSVPSSLRCSHFMSAGKKT